MISLFLFVVGGNSLNNLIELKTININQTDTTVPLLSDCAEVSCSPVLFCVISCRTRMTRSVNTEPNFFFLKWFAYFSTLFYTTTLGKETKLFIFLLFLVVSKHTFNFLLLFKNFDWGYSLHLQVFVKTKSLFLSDRFFRRYLWCWNCFSVVAPCGSTVVLVR